MCRSKRAMKELYERLERQNHHCQWKRAKAVPTVVIGISYRVSERDPILR